MNNFRKRLVEGLKATKTVTKVNSRKSYTLSSSNYTINTTSTAINLLSLIITKYNITTRTQYVYGDGYVKWGNDSTTKDVTFTNNINAANNSQGIFYFNINSSTANTSFSLKPYGSSRFEIEHTKPAGTYKYWPTLAFTYYDYDNGRYYSNVTSAGLGVAPAFHIEINKPDSDTIVGTTVTIVKDN